MTERGHSAQMAKENLISVEEAADQLGVSAETVRRLCRAGSIKAERMGRGWIIYGDELPKNVRKRRRPAPQRGTLDFERAAAQVFRTDVRELWAPDPLRWEDLRKDTDHLISEAANRVANGGPFDPGVSVNVAKTPLLSRPGYMPSVLDRIAYHAVIASFAPQIEALISDLEKAVGRTVVFSARTSTDPQYLFKFWRILWLRFKNTIDKYVDKGFEYMVRSDIVGYYESMQHSALFPAIEATGAEAEAVRALRTMLTLWCPIRGVGIPQGPDASRALGNLYLVPVDQEMCHGHPWIYFRYMDDIRIMGRTRRDVVEGTTLLQEACRRRGLLLGSEKTVLLVGDDAKADLRQEEDLDRARYLFDIRRNKKQALPLLKKILKAALGQGGQLHAKKAKFSLWRLADSRDSTMVGRVCRSLEDLAPIAQIVAQFLQRFIRRHHVQQKIGVFLNDPARNLSPTLSSWLLAVCLDLPYDPPHDWASYARRVTFDGNRPQYERAIAASVLARGRQLADIEALRNALIREFQPELARGFVVALGRVGALDKGTANSVTARMPGLAVTIEYMKGRSDLPSLIYPEDTSPVVTPRS